MQKQLIEDLLDMSRIISGKVRLDVQQVDLPELITCDRKSGQRQMKERASGTDSRPAPGR